MLKNIPVVRKWLSLWLVLLMLLGGVGIFVENGTHASLVDVFYDDMENGTNSWNATGFWHRVWNHTGAPTWNISYSGSYSWWYGQDGTGNYDNGARNYGNLTSPDITVSQYPAVLSFRSYYETETQNRTPDERKVLISVDNGTFQEVANLSSDPMDVWNSYSYDLTSFMQPAYQYDLPWTKEGTVFSASLSDEVGGPLGPCVIKDNGIYKMWYWAKDSSDTRRIFYATSTDGVRWTKYGVVVDVGGVGDSASVSYPSVIKEGGIYKMWYTGSNGSGNRIYYATSPDGITWTKQGAVLSPGPSSYDGRSVDRACIVEDNNVYKMWYSASELNTTIFRIAYAISLDGVNWVKKGIVIDYGDSYESKAVLAPYILKMSDGMYWMWYTAYNWDGARIKSAVSPDGISWSKGDVEINFGDSTAPNSVWSCSVLFDGARLKMWYGGIDWYGPEKINLATTSVAQIPHTIKIRFNFDTVDAFNNSYQGWYIDDFSVKETTLPVVIDTVPTSGGANIMPDTNVVVVFDRSMNTSIIPQLTQISGTDPGNWSFVGWSSTNVENDTAMWSHDNWTQGDSVTLRVSDYADYANDYGSPYDWSFTVVVLYGVSFSPSQQNGIDDPGKSVYYTLTVTNEAYMNDTYDLTVTGNAWPVTIYDSTGTNPINQISVDAGFTADVTVRVDIPAIAVSGDYDVATIAATSQNDSSVSDSSDIVTLTPFLAPWLDDFEYGVFGGSTGYNWTTTDSTRSGVSTDTSESGSYSMYTRSGVVSLTSMPVNTSSLSRVRIKMWIRQGGAFGNSENPDSGEDLSVQYLNASGSWKTLETFPGADPAGTIYIRSYDLAPDAIHSRFQVKFTQTGGSGASYDWWHIDDVSVASPPPYEMHMTPGNQSSSSEPDTSVWYNLTINNTGLNDDTYDLTVSGNAWPTQAYDSRRNTPISSVSAGSGQTVNITVRVYVPVSAALWTSDFASISAVSQNDTNVSAISTIKTTAIPHPAPWYDDMENGTNGWNATGFWHRVWNHTGAPAWNISYSGSYSWWYGQDGTGNYDNGARNYGNLTSPDIKVSQYPAVLSFRSYYETETQNSTPDERKVLISVDNGTFQEVANLSMDPMGVWNGYSYNLTKFMLSYGYQLPWTKQGAVVTANLSEDSGGPQAPSVIKDNGTYKMWYTGVDSSNTRRILYATSPDGVTWTKHGVVLSPDGIVETNVAYCSVIKDGALYRMWYYGYNSTSKKIMYATSSDGINWVKQGIALLPGPGSYDSVALSSPFVLKENGMFKMWYNAYDGTASRIAYASSLDGLNWTKYGVVVDYGDSYESQSVRDPTVVRMPDGIYRMWYTAENSDSGVNHYRIKSAESKDGLTWTKLGLEIDFGESYAPDGAYLPCVLFDRDNDELKMWYTGMDWSGPEMIDLAITPVTTSVATSPHTIRVRFSFDTVTDLNNSYQGWYIDDFCIDSNLPPSVISTVPQSSSTGVDPGEDVVIVFDRSMDTTKIPRIYQMTGRDPGNWSFAGWSTTNVAGDTATWTHDRWDYYDNITLTLTNYIDEYGLCGSVYTWNFSIRGHAATATGPTNTLPSSSGSITITYMNESGATSIALYYTDDGGSTWNFIGNDASIDGSYPWTIPADGSYGWIAVADGETAPVSGDVPEAGYYTYDATPPSVVSTVPSDSAVDISVGEDVVVVFSESMDSSLIPTLTQESGTSVIYTFAGWSTTNVENDTARWTHPSWNYAETLHMNVSGAMDIAGNIQLYHVWSFNTSLGPKATATGPVNTLPSNVASVVITYTNESGATIVGLYYTVDGGGTWNFIGNDTTIDGSYSWTIPADGTYGWIAVGEGESPPVGGDAPEAGYYTYDSISPTVVSTDPADAAVDISVSRNVVVVFSESMDSSVVPTLTQTSGTDVTYTFVGWSTTNVNDDTATWTHTDWANNATIGLTVSGARDVAGNAQISYSWSFTSEMLYTATATGPANANPSNVGSITITYTYVSGTTSVYLYYTTDGGSTWNFMGSDNTIDGSYPWTLPSDGTYGWIAVGDGETAPASGDAPEAGYYTYDGTAPTVVSTDPVDGATGVLVDLPIVITFSEPINTSSFAFTCEPDPGSWSISWNSTSERVTLDHASFALGTTYWINITSSEDIAGNALSVVPYSFNFTTEPGDTTPPIVVTTDPTDGASAVPVDSAIVIAFNESMNTSSVQSAFSTNPAITGTFSWDAANKTLTFSPSSTLSGSTVYSVTINGSIAKDVSGNPLDGNGDGIGGDDYSWQFTTEEVDETPPSSYVSPLDSYWQTFIISLSLHASDDKGLEGVTMYYRFSQDNRTWSQWTQWKDAISASGTAWSSSVTFDFPDGNGYYQFRTIATDTSGNIEVKNSADVLFASDTVAPMIDIVSPITNSLLNSSAVSVRWTGEDLLSGISHYEIRIDSGPWIELGEDTEYTFTGLSDGQHTINIIAQDNAGNIAMDSVSMSIDTGAPRLLFSTPEDGASNVNVSSTITLTFSESMAGLNFSCTPSLGNWSIEWSDVNTVATIGADKLQYGVNYTFVLTDATDLAGNHLSERPIYLVFSTEEAEETQNTSASEEGAYMRGKVVDPNSNPIIGAVIYVDGKPAGVTDLTGSFNISLTPGAHEIRINKTGYEDWTSDISVVEGEKADIGSIHLPMLASSNPPPSFSILPILAVILLIIAVVLILLIVRRKKGGGNAETPPFTGQRAVVPPPPPEPQGGQGQVSPPPPM